MGRLFISFNLIVTYAGLSWSKEMEITFINHAKIKLEILNKHSVKLTEADVKETVKNPDLVLDGRNNRIIAQRIIDDEHMLRVIYEKNKDNIKIITFYPTRRYRYESKI